MTFYYSMKQMLRSPLKSILFFLLIGASAFLMALGGNLWHMNTAMMKEFEEIFTTIGTVEQKKDQVVTSEMWHADKQEYTYANVSTFGERIADSVLDFEGAGYILDAKQRPYFGAYVEELYDGVGNDMTNVVAEVTPLYTGIANESLPMRVERVLGGYLESGQTIYICDHYNDQPRTFEAGKTYIMMLWYAGFVHGSRVENIKYEDYVAEYTIDNRVGSFQYTLDGERVFDPVGEIETDEVDVVTEGFYETERGKRWLERAKTQDYYLHTVPVTPLDGTKLLLPFYKGEATVIEGRDITEEEYAEGKNVCLISRELAALLRITVGDKLTLPLYYADYRQSAGGGLNKLLHFPDSILNAEGEIYPVFHEQDYEIVGVYQDKTTESSTYSLGQNEVLIPWNAIPENAWKDNIAGFGPMRASTTSFQIPNGSISEFTAAWEEQGMEGLDIRFYDNGYTQLQSGLENRKVMAWIFLISGCVMALMILLFFANLFITGQKERIAVERLLGLTKRQCAASVLTGLLILASAGIAVGSAAGFVATDVAVRATEDTIQFDSIYSNVVIEDANSGDGEEAEQKPGAAAAAVSGSVLLLAACGISVLYMKEMLKREPLEILGTLEE